MHSLQKFKEFTKEHKAELLVACLFVVVITGFAWVPAFRGTSIEDGTNAGQFGDFIGGYFGTVFLIFSVAILFGSYRDQRTTNRRNIVESRFFEMLGYHRENVADLGIDDGKLGHRVFVSLIREFRDVWKIVDRADPEYPAARKLDLAYMAFYYGVGPNSTRILKDALGKDHPVELVAKVSIQLTAIQKKYRTLEETIYNGGGSEESIKFRVSHEWAKKKLTSTSYRPFDGHQSRLGHYYRHLFQIAKYIKQQGGEQAEQYAGFLRSQLSNHEQALLCLNALSAIGSKWRTERLISEYSLIKNVPRSFFPEIMLDIKKEFPDITFEFQRDGQATEEPNRNPPESVTQFDLTPLDMQKQTLVKTATTSRPEEIELSRTTLLLGSGISRPSGYPLTSEVTEKLLSQIWTFERDQARSEISLHSPMLGGEYALRTEAMTGLIRILRNHTDQHFAMHGKGQPTYEDVYYLARQLLDALRGEYDNPGLLPLMLELRPKVSLMFENLNAVYGRGRLFDEYESTGLAPLLEKVLEFIEECVAHQLAPRPDVCGLTFLTELLDLNADSPLHLVSLNHDDLVERHLSDHEISDGFRVFSPGIDRFDPSSFDDTIAFRVRLLKPHGSIDWFRYKHPTSGEDLILRVRSGDRDHLKGPEGESMFPTQGRMLLAGTTNKELAYGSGLFIELMFQFQKRLKETSLLITSGYGFADKGINNRLWAWLDSRPENRVVVLHEDIGELRRAAKPSFSHNMDRHKESGKFVLVDKWMCDCTLEDVKREMRLAAR